MTKTKSEAAQYAEWINFIDQEFPEYEEMELIQKAFAFKALTEDYPSDYFDEDGELVEQTEDDVEIRVNKLSWDETGVGVRKLVKSTKELFPSLSIKALSVSATLRNCAEAVWNGVEVSVGGKTTYWWDTDDFSIADLTFGPMW